MSTNTMRNKLHSYLELADDKKIKALFTIVESEIIEASIEYSENFKEELDNRLSNIKNGKSKLINKFESKKRIQNILRKHR